MCEVESLSKEWKPPGVGVAEVSVADGFSSMLIGEGGGTGADGVNSSIDFSAF